MISLLVQQVGDVPAIRHVPVVSLATVLMTGLERVVTVATDAYLPRMVARDLAPHVYDLLAAEAWVLELSIRNARETAQRGRL